MKYDFCSKKLYSVTGSTGEFGIYRDYKKSLATRQFYTKKNVHMLSNAAAHAGAIF